MSHNWTCYGSNQYGNFISANFAPCGPINKTNPVVPCCERGDICYNDNLCFYGNPKPSGTGYYTGECTDPNWGAGCANRCADTNIPEVIYINNAWFCCGKNLTTGEATCKTPTDETFNGPAPSNLIAYYTVPLIGDSTPLPEWSSSSTAVSTSSASSSATASTMTVAASSQSTSEGLAPGAIAGIVIGVVLGVLLIFSGIGLYCFHSRRTTFAKTSEEHTNITPYAPVAPTQEQWAYVSELPDNGQYVEMETAGSPRELEGKPKFPYVLQHAQVDISAQRE